MIDYFVENNLRVKKYWTFEREFTNLSTHDPIIVTVACKLQSIDINSQRQDYFQQNSRSVTYLCY
jgi:hypothetical protein